MDGSDFKLLQKIKMSISCDMCVYNSKILGSRAVECFDTSAILNFSLQSRMPCTSKWDCLPEKIGIHTVLQVFGTFPNPEYLFDL